MMREAVIGLILILSLIFLGSSGYSAEKKIVLNKYPNLKIGFTTANFLRVLPVTLENTKKLIDFASDQGFTWIELRDPNAVLTLAECKQVAEYARGKKIEIAYALGVGLMDGNFWEVFSRGLANAIVFDGPRTLRTAAPGDEFNINPKKTAWTLNELHKTVKIANKAGNQARASGLKYVTENAFEVIRGDGITSFGTTEYFANVNSNVLWQLDTANFFCLGRNVAKPEEASAFLEKHAGKLVYIHLKTSSKDHKPQPILSDNELDFNIVFSLMTKQKVPYVAIELAQVPTIEECYENHKKSVEYLLKNY
jgi:sugar phosphate isomerase/epimerase